MKLNLGIVATAATKKPSPKAVKKAEDTLRRAAKANIDAAKAKLQEVIGKAVELHNDMQAQLKVNAAQRDKLQAQLDKLNQRDAAFAQKAKDRILKLVPRITKMQDEFLQMGGKDIVPAILKPYFGVAPSEKRAKKTKRPVAK